jgi:hypothetical protein
MFGVGFAYGLRRLSVPTRIGTDSSVRIGDESGREYRRSTSDSR